MIKRYVAYREIPKEPASNLILFISKPDDGLKHRRAVSRTVIELRRSCVAEQ